MRRRHYIVLAIALVVVAAAVFAVLSLRGRPPRAVRLLPAADGYVYVDLRPLRAAGLFKNMPSVDPDYAQFVRDTGFEFERDLDQAAFAVHLPSAADAGNSQAPPETRFSEVFVGRFDHPKLAAYLHRTAATTRSYRNSIIYEIPLPGRTVRVAVLDKNTVAASNTESRSVIQGVIDRYGETFGPGGGDLLRGYYRHVPLASIAWAVSRAAPQGEQGNATFVLPGGFNLFFPPRTVVVAGVRYLGSVQFRAQAFTRTQEEAQRISDQLNAFLAVARTIEIREQEGSTDPDIKSFFDSINVSQSQGRAELNATIPPGLLKKIVSEAPPVNVVSPAPAPAPDKKKSTTETRRHRGKRRK